MGAQKPQYIGHDTTKYSIELFKQLLKEKEIQFQSTKLDAIDTYIRTNLEMPLKELAEENRDYAYNLKKYGEIAELEEGLSSRTNMDIYTSSKRKFALGRLSTNKNVFIYLSKLKTTTKCIIF